ncbi:VanZ family protein [Streptomyces sp. NPDC046939]|uniref:VanZ family protein n=1 Tax=Streptomyces sp. NPDC046939 TaxID=3155376 RepID=UPI0033D6106E
MFSAIFQHHVGYLAACVVLGLMVAAAAWAVANKCGNPRGPWWSGLAFTLTGVLGVTFMGGGRASGVCVLNHQFSEPFHTTQGLWNLAMMVPVGAFALLAVRRPLPVLLGVIALPLAIEITQATVNGLGRVCDSSDAEMNILGGLLGLAVVAVLLDRRRPLAWQAGARGTLISSVAFLVLISGVARSMLDFTNVDGSSLRAANSEQERAVEAAVAEAFGDRYEIGQLNEQPCVDAPCTNIIFILHSREAGHTDDFGSGSLSWPDKKHLNVQVEDSDRPGVMGYPVEGARAPSSEQAASAVAKQYARAKYPWVSGASTTETSPVGEKAERGWMTSWRWTYNDILMPRTLDVQVDRAGRVSQVDVTLGPTRAEVRDAKLESRQAEKAVTEVVTEQLRANGTIGAEFTTKAITLKAFERDGKWEPHWLVNVMESPNGKSEEASEPAPVETYRVNALTGQVYDSGGKLLRS